MQVNGLEAGRAWAYQIDGGDWQAVSGSAGLNTVAVSGQRTGGTDGLRKVRVKQTDAAGNETVSSELSFTLDTIDPVFSSDIRLQFDSGRSDIDGITNNGRIIVPAPEAGASWSYRIDTGSFQNGGSTNIVEVPSGIHDVTVRMTDVAGNFTERSKHVTVDTLPPTAPTLTLVNDTGDFNNDRKTRDGNVRVSGLEPGASWKYRIGASTYQPGSDTNTFDATAGSDGERQVSVIQIDEAGNEGPAAELIFTVDRTGPALVLSLLNKTGSTAAAITKDGTVKVEGLEAGRTWQYQIGEGTWQNGSGTTFVVPGANVSGGSDGIKKVRVKQSDVAGNETITAQFEFTLDTTPPIKPVLALVRDTAGVAGSSITTDTDKITSDGRVRISNIEAGAKVEYSFNNTDWLVLTGDTLTPLLDISKEVYMMTRGANTWYMWAPINSDFINGGFIISRTSGSDEWYQGAQYPSDPKTRYANKEFLAWRANSGRAIDLQGQQLLNNGVSPNSSQLKDVEIYAAFGNYNQNRSKSTISYVEQTDVAGNVSIYKEGPRDYTPEARTLAPPSLDLDDVLAGTQTTVSRTVSNTDLQGTTVLFAPGANALGMPRPFAWAAEVVTTSVPRISTLKVGS